MSAPSTAPRRSRLALAGLGATGLLVALVPPAAPAAAARTATVNVVHGIPGATVNVCVDGGAAIRDFTYGEKAVGVALPAGKHRVRVVAAGKPCSSAAILRHRYVLDAGRNYTVVAAVRPSGAPALRAFVNDVRRVDAGKARLTVRHTAQAPAVNVWANGAKLIGGHRYTSGDSRTFAVPKGSYRVKVTLPDRRKPVIGPTSLMLRSGRAYQVYAVGTPGDYRLVVARAKLRAP
jgi:hypothetical protein